MQTETAWAKSTFTIDEMIALDAIIGKHAPRMTKSLTEARDRLSSTAARAGVSVADAKVMLAKAKTTTVAAAKKAKAPVAPKTKVAAKPKAAPAKKAAPKAAKPATTAKSAPSGSKLDIVEKALRKPAGATLDALSALTGWKAHTVRARIAVDLKRDRALKVTSERVEGKSVYRIQAEG